MTEDQRSIVISEDYVDLILNFNVQEQFLQRNPDAITEVMNPGVAFAYVPVTEFVKKGIGFYGYAQIPSLYGLTSDTSLEASGVANLRRMPNFNLRGSGVLIGIIDTGINYTLPVFKKADGTTKILYLWDQTIQSENYPIDTSAKFGTEYASGQINRAIQSEEPYQIVPSTDDNGHGTMLAAIAAGSDMKDNNFFGVAPDAELVVVKLMPAKKSLRDIYYVPEDVLCYQGNSIMWGLQYCLTRARLLNRPISMCIALGTSQNSHDGISSLDGYVSAFSRILKSGIVCSAGNEGNKGRHFFGVINPAVGSIPVELYVGENENDFSMQLWGTSPGIYSIDILSPSGEYIPRIAASLSVNRVIAFIFDNTTINVIYQTAEGRTGDQLIFLRFKNISPGTWKFNVYGQGNLVNSFHIWLPMGNMISEVTRFIQPDIYTTVLSPGTAIDVITVTAYDPISNILYVDASRGYTRSNNIKPELAAPGVNYKAPNKDGEIVSYSGTGVAAAHTTGIVALMMEWGEVLGNQNNISSLNIKNYLIRGANRSKNLTYPNRDWGYGILDIYNAFNVLRSTT